LHIVPPPQTLALHWFEQHCAAVVHAVPSAPHADPQTPPGHPPEQHSDGATHVSPSFLQTGAAHRPASQNPEQQDVPKSQRSSAPRHVGAHWPPSHLPEQHSPAAAHAPLALQPVPVDGPLACPAPAPPPPNSTVAPPLQPKASANVEGTRSAQDKRPRKLTSTEGITRGQTRSTLVRGANAGMAAKAENCWAS
jgi:hypothetical protein